MGMSSTTQAFQFATDYAQLFQAAMTAVQGVKKASLTAADMNANYLSFETPFGLMSYGERVVVGFVPSSQGVVVEVTCTTKGIPNLMQDGRNRKLIAQFVEGLANLVRVAPVEVARS